MRSIKEMDKRLDEREQEIEQLHKKLDAQDKIINEQALEIARLKEWKEDLLNENIELENIRKEAIEYIKEHQRKDEFLNLNEWQTRDLLEILGDKE